MRKLAACFLALAFALAPAARATVTTTGASVTYTGNGSTTAYVTGFRFLANTDLVVVVNNVTKTLTTDYTVTGAGVSTGGTVTFVAAPALGSSVVITRNTPKVQSTGLPTQGPFLPKTHEAAWDRLTLELQEIDAKGLGTAAYIDAAISAIVSGGSVVQPVSWYLTGTGSTTVFSIPNATVSNADLYIVTIDGVFQRPTTDYTVSSTFGQITFITAPALNAVISVRSTGYAKALSVGDNTSVVATGSTASRDLAHRFAESANPLNYGADPTGVVDSAAAMQLAWNAAAANSGKLRIPCGTYLLSAPISITNTFFGGNIEGESANCVTLKATAFMTSVFFYTDGGPNGRFAFREITIDGNSLAQSGIYSHLFRTSYFERVLVKGTTVAAVDLAEGWSNDFMHCEFSGNSGDGLRLGTNANQVNILNSMILNNAGWAVRITAGPGPVNIRGSDIENNQKGGIYLASGAGTANNGVLNVKDNYFEGNASYSLSATTVNGSPNVTANAAAIAVANANVGKAYYGASIPASTTIVSASGTTIVLSANATASTTEFEWITVGDTLSATSVLADIVLNGSGDNTTLAETYPIQAANIEGNLVTAHGETIFVGYTAGKNVRLVGNVKTTYSSRVLIIFSASLLSPTYPLGALTIQDNDGFTGFNGVGDFTHGRAALLAPNGGSVVIDLSLGTEFVITPTSATAFTISDPTNRLGSASRFQYQRFTLRVRNATGGVLGAITWGTSYKMPAWTSPANGFSRSVQFTWDSAASAWVEEFRSAADVPN